MDEEGSKAGCVICYRTAIWIRCTYSINVSTRIGTLLGSHEPHVIRHMGHVGHLSPPRPPLSREELKMEWEAFKKKQETEKAEASTVIKV